MVNISQTFRLVSDPKGRSYLCSIPTENILFTCEMHRQGYPPLAAATELKSQMCPGLSEDLSQLWVLSCLQLSVPSSLRTLWRDSDPFIHSDFYPWLIPSI